MLKADEQPDVAETVRQRYPDLGRCLYFDIAQGTHAVVYELPKHRLNWLWYDTALLPRPLGALPDTDIVPSPFEMARFY